MDNVVTTLQAAIEARLKENATLAGFEIITEDRGDLETAIEMALAQLGLFLLIGTAKLGVSNPNLPGPVFDRVTFFVEVVENVTLNRTGAESYDAKSVAIMVAEQLHQWRPVNVGHFSGRTCLVESNAITDVQQGDVLAYDVNFNLGK